MKQVKKPSSADYLELLEERKKSSHSKITRSFQFAGLALAEILGDRLHKSLYIRLAKLYDYQTLMTLAKETASRNGVKNKGAYFMSLLKTMRKEGKLEKKASIK